MRKHITILLSLFMSSLFYVTAIAAPKEDVNGDEPPQGENSINLNPIGALFGSYSLNYERLVNGSHGFIGELSYSSTSDDQSSSSSLGGAFGYRWHWSQSQNSGFLGAMVGYSRGSAETKVNDNSFDLAVSAPSFTLNIGRRWAWNSGLTSLSALELVAHFMT